MRVFLTGASGYLGGVLTAHLAALPEVEAITGVELQSDKYSAGLPPNLMPGDSVDE